MNESDTRPRPQSGHPAHLSLEALAASLDEPLSPERRRHLASCPTCRSERAALARHRDEMARLVTRLPPADAEGRSSWDRLASRLAREGAEATSPALSPSDRAAPARRPSRSWPRAAAVAAVFLAGAAVGWGGAGMTATGDIVPGGGPLGETTPLAAVLESLQRPGELTLEASEEIVQLTHGWHLDALTAYRTHLEQDGAVGSDDPILRFLLLDELLAAAEMAVRESPADPFLNGLLASTAAERAFALDAIALAVATP